MRVSTPRISTLPIPDHRLPLAGSARAAAAGPAPETGGRRDQARSRRSGLPHAPKLHRIRQAFRTLLAALCAWSGEKYGIDPAYLGLLLVASFELGMQRFLGK
jgi:hypothetical protein